MNEDTLATWIAMQQKVWHGETSSKAVWFMLRRRDSEDSVFRCAVEGEDVVSIIRRGIADQRSELPKGAHQYVLVALDADGHQVGELPQTIRGTNQDATTAATEMLTMQTATARMIANMDQVTQMATRVGEQLHTMLESERELSNALLTKYREATESNFDAQLKLEEFRQDQKRKDLIAENLAPVAGVFLEQFAQNLLAKNPNLLGGALGGAPNEPQRSAEPKREPTPEPKPVEPESGTTTTTESKPSGSAVPEFHEPRPASLPEHSQARGKGSTRVPGGRSSKPPKKR